jgi:hypothetical protein
MKLVCDWWTEELAPHLCWGIADVGRRGQVLIHFVNKPARGYHALSAIFQLFSTRVQAATSPVCSVSATTPAVKGEHTANAGVSQAATSPWLPSQ